MIQLGLTARDRRVLIMGVSVILPALGVGRGLPALLDWQNAYARNRFSTFQQSIQDRVDARRAPELRDSLAARRSRLAALDSTLITGSTTSAAAAMLATMLGELADSAPLKLTSMQLRSDSAAAGVLTTVGVRIAGLADVAGLMAFLRAIEGGERLLIVREISISQPEPAAPDPKPEVLRVDVLVEALVRVTTEAPR